MSLAGSRQWRAANCASTSRSNSRACCASSLSNKKFQTTRETPAVAPGVGRTLSFVSASSSAHPTLPDAFVSNGRAAETQPYRRGISGSSALVAFPPPPKRTRSAAAEESRFQHLRQSPLVSLRALSSEDASALLQEMGAAQKSHCSTTTTPRTAPDSRAKETFFEEGRGVLDAGQFPSAVGSSLGFLSSPLLDGGSSSESASKASRSEGGEETARLTAEFQTPFLSTPRAAGDLFFTESKRHASEKHAGRSGVFAAGACPTGTKLGAEETALETQGSFLAVRRNHECTHGTREAAFPLPLPLPFGLIFDLILRFQTSSRQAPLLQTAQPCEEASAVFPRRFLWAGGNSQSDDFGQALWPTEEDTPFQEPPTFCVFQKQPERDFQRFPGSCGEVGFQAQVSQPAENVRLAQCTTPLQNWKQQPLPPSNLSYPAMTATPMFFSNVAANSVQGVPPAGLVFYSEKEKRDAAEASQLQPPVNAAQPSPSKGTRNALSSRQGMAESAETANPSRSASARPAEDRVSSSLMSSSDPSQENALIEDSSWSAVESARLGRLLQPLSLPIDAGEERQFKRGKLATSSISPASCLLFVGSSDGWVVQTIRRFCVK